MPATEQDQPVKRSLKTFLLLFLALGALLATMIVVFYQLETRNNNQRLSVEEQHSLDLQLAVVRNHFNSIISDLSFLTGQEDLMAYLETPSAQLLAPVAREYQTFSASKRIYDQIRYLDEKGLEIVRVNYNAGVPAIVAKEGLQNKLKRYYFSDAFKLGQKQIFISPLDLNIEHGMVEIPFKPMIRFGAPVFDQSGNKRGIVLLNYLGKHLLDLIQDVSSVAHGQTMLLNADGYWLKHPEAVKEWGFMLEGGGSLSFARQFPELWKQVLATPSGQIQTPEGIYTFATLNPFEGQAKGAINPDGYFWKVVSFISAEKLASYSQGLLGNLLALGGGLLFLAAAVAWFLTVAVVRRKRYREQLFNMAHFDNLTGLPNRTLFFDRLKQTLELAKRHSRQSALLYIDLDGFKSVNDRLGHAAGDELLVVIADRMKSCCRSSDTVARLGGDEFAILLSEVFGVEGARTCTEKFLVSMEEPFVLTHGEAKIGASVGIGMFPGDGVTPDALLKSADQAMYRSKKRGKNTFTFAAEDVSEELRDENVSDNNP